MRERRLFTSTEIAVSTHPRPDPAGTFGRRRISPQRIRDDPLDAGWRKNGLRAMIDLAMRAAETDNSLLVHRVSITAFNRGE